MKVVIDDGEMDGWVLAVGQKRTLNALSKEHFDLATYPVDRRGQRYAGLPDPFLVLSEIPDATAAILNPTVSRSRFLLASLGGCASKLTQNLPFPYSGLQTDLRSPKCYRLPLLLGPILWT